MRSIKEIINLPESELTKAELKHLEQYRQVRRVRHATSFVFHGRRLPEEPKNGQPHKH